MKQHEILWEQTIYADINWLNKGFYLGLCCIFGAIIYSDLSLIIQATGREFNVWFWSILRIGCFAYIGGYLIVSQIFVAATLKYQIKEDTLIYNWGFEKSILVEIPFTDFTSINLVEYNNSDESTIYLVTKGDYPKLFKGSFDNRDPRHTYTLEKIKNGPKVYQLMMKQWKHARSQSIN